MRRSICRQTYATGLIALGLFLAGTATAQSSVEPSPLSATQSVAAARAGEALYMAERTAKLFWPTMKVDKVALLIVEPGGWALLLNHPSPPPGFRAQKPIPRRRSEEDIAREPSDANPPPFSLHAAGPDAATWTRSGTISLGGVSTAVVLWNEVTLPAPAFGGTPPAEAAICRMVRGLWLADRHETEGTWSGSYPWEYVASDEDLASIALEQRLLAKLGRAIVNEKTMDQYRKNFSMWLAVRRARLAANPTAVAMEEGIELREGLADFTETVTFRVLESPGGEERPELEAVDPFFEQYKNYFIIRLNLLNYPLTWYPSDPVEALMRSRASGASVAYALSPIAAFWHKSFFPSDGSAPKPLRDVAAETLALDPNSEPALLDEARSSGGYPLLRSLARESLARNEAAGQARLAELESPGRVQVSIAPGPGGILRFEAPAGRIRWLGPGRIEASGPVKISLAGGELMVEEGPVTVQAAGAPAGMSAPTVSLPLPPDWKASVAGQEVRLPDGKKNRRLEGSFRLEGRGVRLGLEGGLVSLGSGRIEVQSRPAPPAPPQGAPAAPGR